MGCAINGLDNSRRSWKCICLSKAWHHVLLPLGGDTVPLQVEAFIFNADYWALKRCNPAREVHKGRFKTELTLDNLMTSIR
eukprot:1811501-Amphidinium_carterae.1